MTTTEGITMREPHIVQAIRNIAGRKSTRGTTARMGPRLGAWALIGALSCVALRGRLRIFPEITHKLDDMGCRLTELVK